MYRNLESEKSPTFAQKKESSNSMDVLCVMSIDRQHIERVKTQIRETFGSVLLSLFLLLSQTKAKTER